MDRGWRETWCRSSRGYYCKEIAPVKSINSTNIADYCRVAATVLSPPGSILCYHSVTTADLPSASVVNVPRAELEAAIALVRTLAEIVPLTVLVERHRARKSTRGLAALTFDDAYV